MAGKFSDTYELKAEADVGALDRVADELRDLSGATDQVGRSADRIADDVREASNELFDLDDAADQAGKGVKDAGDEAEEAGAGFGILNKLAGLSLKTLLGFAGVTLSVGAILGTGISDVLGWSSAMNEVEARTGLAGEALDAFKGNAQLLFTQGWGESIDAVTEAMVTVKQITGEDDPIALRRMTEDAIVFGQAFDRDVNETVRAARLLAEQLGIDYGTAFDLMTRSMQITGDPANDLLDTISEYSSTFADMGFTADEMMSIITSGLEAGAYNTDVIADAMREYNIRLQDGTSELALMELGLGGVSNQFKAGEITAADMFDQVIAGLLNMDDPIARQTAGVALFGTKWEDMGDDVLLGMTSANEGLADFEGATDRAGAALQNGLGPAWDRVTRSLRVGLSNSLEPLLVKVLDGLLPAFDSVTDWLDNEGLPSFDRLWGLIRDGAGEVTGLLDQLGALDPLKTLIGEVVDLGSGMVDVFANLSPQSLILIGLTLAAMAAPAVIGALAAGLATVFGFLTAPLAAAGLPLLVVLGLVAAYETNFGGLKDAIDKVVSAIKGGDLKGAIMGVAEALLAIPLGIADAIGDLIGVDVAAGLAAWEGPIDAAKLAFDGLKEAGANGLAALGGAFSRARNTIDGKLNEVVTFVTDLPGRISGGLSGIGDTATTALAPFGGAFETAKGVATGAFNAVVTAAGGLGMLITIALGGLDGVLGTNFSGVFQSAVDLVRGLFDDPVAGVKGILYSLITNIIPSTLSTLDGVLGTNLTERFNTAVATITGLFGGEGGLAAALSALPGLLGEWLGGLEGKLREMLLTPFNNVLTELKNKVLDTPIIGDVIKAGGSIVEFVGGISPFADGGGARAGLPALVGEDGPELMIPGRSSGIVSNNDLRRALGGMAISGGRGAAGGATVMDFNGANFQFYGVQNVPQLLDELEKVKARRAYTRKGVQL